MTKEFIVDFTILIDGKAEACSFGARARDEKAAKQQAIRSVANHYYRTIVAEKYCHVRNEGGMAIISAKVTRCGE